MKISILPFYFLLYLVVWIIFKCSNNYSVLMGSRNFLKYSFMGLCLIIPLNTIVSVVLEPNKESIFFLWGFCILFPLMWNFWMFMWGLNFYDSSHVKNLTYFVLYLRSFKDDKNKKSAERKLMRAMYAFFCPFAVGKPDEIKSSAGSALKLYVGDDWKERVTEMMENAPIILLRVSNTENFFWEFEQCIIKKHIEKSIFWVSNIESYKAFREVAENQYHLTFPIVEEVTDNCVIFQEGYKSSIEERNFTVFKFNLLESYSKFIQKYNNLRHISSSNLHYFSGRNRSIVKQFFTWKRDSSMRSGIQEWCWTAFFFPELYIIFQRFPNRNILYFLYIFCDIGWLFRIPLMIYMGRNAKKTVWLAQKWESVSYFERIHRINNIKTVCYGISLIIVSSFPLFTSKSHSSFQYITAKLWGQ